MEEGIGIATCERNNKGIKEERGVWREGEGRVIQPIYARVTVCMSGMSTYITSVP